MLNEILKIIESNRQEYASDEQPFSYETLKRKKAELVSLGLKLGCRAEDFKVAFDNLETNEMFSIFTLSPWGYYTPTILDDFIIVNRKKSKRLYKKPPANAKRYYKLFVL